MTVPTESDFRQVITQIEDIHAYEDLKNKVRPALVNFKGPDEKIKEIVSAIAHENLTIRKLKAEAVQNTTVFEWYLNQPSIKRRSRKRRNTNVGGRSFERRLQLTVERYLEALRPLTVDSIDKKYQKMTTYSQLSETVESKDSFTVRQNSWEQRLERLISHIRFSIGYQPATEFHLLRVFEALNNYYHTDYWKKLYEEQKQRAKDILEIKKALVLMDRANNYLIDPLNIRIKKHILDQLDSSPIYPSGRLDETLKERTLIFQLYNANIRPTLIFSIMEFEGIDWTLDKRSIERLISKWKTMNRQLIETNN